MTLRERFKTAGSVASIPIRFWLAAALASGVVASAVLVSLPAARTDAPAKWTGTIEPEVVGAASKTGGTVREVAVRAGQQVSRGQVLVRFDVSGIEARRQQLADAVRAAESAIADSRATGRISARARAQLVESHPDVMDAESEYAAALREFENANEGGRAAAQARLDRAGERRVDVRRRLGRLLTGATQAEWWLALIPGLRENIRELDDLLREAEVRAPEDAVVDLLDVVPGQRILPRSPVALLALPGEYYCEIRIPVSEMSRLKVGMAVRGMLQTTHRPIEWRVASVTRRAVPAAFRDDRRVSEEGVVRARVSLPETLRAGTVARFELP